MKKIILYTVTLITLYSCSDFLDQEPDEQISFNEQFSSLQGFEEALNGSYENLESIISGEAYFTFADVMTGNIAFTPALNDSEINIPDAFDEIYSDFIDDPSSSDLDGFYDGAYQVINSVNLILENIDGVPGGTEEQINQIKSEALAMRGFTHFLLTQLYGRDYAYSSDASHLGVVYNTNTLTLGVDFPARLTVEETYAQCISDMEEALSLNTGENALDYGEDYSYFNENVIKGLLARIYLQQNNWGKAEEFADDVINNSGISLMPQNEYITQWMKPDSPVSEVLFELSAPLDDDDGGISSTVSTFYDYISTNDYGNYTASQDVLDQFEDNDIRNINNMFFIENLSTLQEDGTTTSEEPYYFTHKFQGNSGTLVMRLSEMYLIRAEAKARQGNTGGALADLNMIRARAGASLITDTSNVLESIFEERRRELCFEGFYFYDIARYQKDIEREYCISNTCTLNYSSPYFILPIPQSNIELNQNLIQNEGY